MSNQSIKKNIIKDGNGKTKIKVNGRRKGQDLRMKKRKKMLQLIRSLMGHNMEGGRIEDMVRDSYSLGHVVRIILIRIVQRIRVLGFIFIVLRKHRQCSWDTYAKMNVGKKS